jgi:transposase-like protein
MLRAWRRSGLSQTEFCRRQGIHPVTFSGWKRQLSSSADPSGQPADRAGRTSRFVEVRLTDAGCAATYEVILPSGRVIRVPGGFDAETVARLIRAVESC